MSANGGDGFAIHLRRSRKPKGIFHFHLLLLKSQNSLNIYR